MTDTATAAGQTGRTRVLLGCGALAGPLYIVAGLVQAATRPGFDPARHPLSLAGLGELGWIQITSFIVTGALFAASAIGMRRVLRPGRASTWGPVLIGVFGVALVCGGVFVADPALGFPPGTPEGLPGESSWHGTLHNFAPVVAFLALSVACFVFARRSFGLGEQRWAIFSIVTGVGVQVLGFATNATLNFLPMWASMVLGFGWASAQAVRLMPRG